MSQTLGRTSKEHRLPASSGASAYADRLDWILLAAVLTLSVLGIVLVWSATFVEDGGAAGRRQALSLLMALALAFLVTKVEPRALRAWALPLYVTALIGLLLTFSPLGVEVFGARAWLAFPGGFTLQPSEFAKIALIVMVAAVLAGNRSRGQDATAKDAAIALGAAVPLLLIVLAQRDTGTAMVMVCILATLLLVSGAPMRLLAGLGLLAVLFVVAVIAFEVLPDYQMARLTAFLDPEADPFGTGHNTRQARIAIGAGGLFGRGLFNGSQTQGGFVPVNESDFIYTVAVEELGLLGGLVLLGLLAVICWRGIRIAMSAPDLFGRCLATGVVAWFAFQGFENIGMNLGIAPVTGVTLPFVSFGGTSMMAAWVGIGLLQLVKMSGNRND
jgi:rod shape determining protein RodA